ncbi:MAG: DUF2007 domain-containing protein [Chloroflexota bacterium]
MTENEWVTVIEVFDRLEAEILKEAIEAQGIPSQLFQEGLSHYLYPVNGPMGRIQVCVPRTKLSEALTWLEDYKEDNLEGEAFD